MKEYHLLGRTGIRVSPLALGVMTFGQRDWGSDAKTSRAIFERYLETGGNVIDTANVYADGRSEELTGAFINETRTRDQVVLATKFASLTESGNPNAYGNGRKHIMSALDASLRRLQTDYVDLYWLHVWDMVTPVEEVMATLDTLARSGKIHAVGLSNVPAWYAARAHTLAVVHGWEPIAALQMEYSLIQREVEREHVRMAVDLGMSMVPWSPLASGFLTGRYARHAGDIAGSGRLQAPEQRSVREFLGGYGDQEWSVLDTLVKVAAEVDRSPAQVALNWVANRPGVTSTLIGARTVGQLEENLAALDFELSAEQVARLDEVSAPRPVRPYLMFDDAIFDQFLTPGMKVRREPALIRP